MSSLFLHLMKKKNLSRLLSWVHFKRVVEKSPMTSRWDKSLVCCSLPLQSNCHLLDLGAAQTVYCSDFTALDLFYGISQLFLYMVTLWLPFTYMIVFISWMSFSHKDISGLSCFNTWSLELVPVPLFWLGSQKET